MIDLTSAFRECRTPEFASSTLIASVLATAVRVIEDSRPAETFLRAVSSPDSRDLAVKQLYDEAHHVLDQPGTPSRESDSDAALLLYLWVLREVDAVHYYEPVARRAVLRGDFFWARRFSEKLLSSVDSKRISK